MLDALKFVKGTIGREDKLNPALNHFRLSGGRITGQNAVYNLSAPINTDIEATPRGPDFSKAIEKAGDKVVSLAMLENGKLLVKASKMRVNVDCTTEPFHTIQPEGASFWLAPNFVETIKRLLPFVSKDNRKAWASGMLLDGQTLSATDNVSLVQARLGEEFAPPIPVVIPEPTLKELVRIKEAPRYAAVSQRSITFYYGEGERWLSSVVLPNDWPDLTKFFMQKHEAPQIGEEFWQAVEDMAVFTGDDDDLFLSAGSISTSREADAGGHVDGTFPVPMPMRVSCKHLLLLKTFANTIAFGQYPAPMQFYGENIRGVFVGRVM